MAEESSPSKLTLKKLFLKGIPTLFILFWFFWGVGMGLDGRMYGHNSFFLQLVWFFGLGFFIYISSKWFEYVSKNID